MAARTCMANRSVGSIEHVGDDGFIVESSDPQDPEFFGGKRLFKDFDTLLRFLAQHLEVYKSEGNSYGMKRPQADVMPDLKPGDNGVKRLPSPAEARP